MDTKIIVRGNGSRFVIDQQGKLSNREINNIVPISQDDGVTWYADQLTFSRRSRSLAGDLVLHFRVGIGPGGDQVRWISPDGVTGYWDLLKRCYRDSTDHSTKVAA